MIIITGSSYATQKNLVSVLLSSKDDTSYFIIHFDNNKDVNLQDFQDFAVIVCVNDSRMNDLNLIDENLVTSHFHILGTNKNIFTVYHFSALQVDLDNPVLLSNATKHRLYPVEITKAFKLFNNEKAFYRRISIKIVCLLVLFLAIIILAFGYYQVSALLAILSAWGAICLNLFSKDYD